MANQQKIAASGGALRAFCWTCHRPSRACFCLMAVPFFSPVDFALIVHPSEAASTVGTAWILRRSISNLTWIRSKGTDLDQSTDFHRLVSDPSAVPLLLFPGAQALNLNHAEPQDWRALAPAEKRPLFIIIDGTWNQARAMLKRSALLQSLPQVSFETNRPSEYGFKKQPHPSYLSSVEGAHRLIEVLAERGWQPLPELRQHDHMIRIFRAMAQFQLGFGSR